MVSAHSSNTLFDDDHVNSGGDLPMAMVSYCCAEAAAQVQGVENARGIDPSFTATVSKRTRRPRWNGVLAHLFQLGWVSIEDGHWMWHDRVRKKEGTPILTVPGKPNIWDAARVIFDAANNPPIARGWVLSRNKERCCDPRCVSPAHHYVRRRGASAETLKKAQSISHARATSKPIETRLNNRVQKRIGHDDTGCWRWLGVFYKGEAMLRYNVKYGPRENGRRGKFVSSKYLNIRRFMWRQVKGDLPGNHQLHHFFKGCSEAEKCVNPAHMLARSLQDHARTVLVNNSARQRARAARQWVNDQEWPGTSWDPDAETGVCKNCGRDYDSHGAPEWIGRKLNVPLNRFAYICRPILNPRRVLRRKAPKPTPGA